MNEDNINNTPEMPEQQPPKKKGSKLATRSLTAIFIAILYVAPIALGLFVRKEFYDALVLFLMIAASYEFTRAVSAKFDRPLEAFAYINIGVGYVVFKLVDHFVGFGAITSYFGVLALTFVACVVYTMIVKKPGIGGIVSTLFVLIYPVAIMSYLLALNYLGDYSAVAILLAFITTTLTDTMAYFVGSTLHGPKLCPNISPNKTVSGAIGGLVGGILGGLLVMVFAKFELLNCVPITAATVPNVLHFIFLGLGSALFCQIGDLTASYVKRTCGIKDFGKILKGHGGFMDRIDGLIITALFIYVYFAILGVAL